MKSVKLSKLNENGDAEAGLEVGIELLENYKDSFLRNIFINRLSKKLKNNIKKIQLKPAKYLAIIVKKSETEKGETILAKYPKEDIDGCIGHFVNIEFTEGVMDRKNNKVVNKLSDCFLLTVDVDQSNRVKVYR